MPTETEAPFVVGDGATGVPPGDAPGDGPAVGDAVLDVLSKYAERQAKAEPEAMPPAGLTPVQQMGASMLAALDPDAYAKIVVPQLEQAQNAQRMEQVRVQSKQEREDRLFRAWLAVAQQKDALELRREQATETARAHRESEDIRRDTQDVLATEREQAKQTAAQSIKGVTGGVKGIIASIDGLVQTASPIDRPVLAAVRANAVALDTQVAEFLASGQEAAPATAQQFENKYGQLASQHFQAMLSAGQRAQTAANRALMGARSYMSASAAMAFGSETKEPMNRLLDVRRMFDENVDRWTTLYGTDMVPFKGKVLDQTLLDFRASYATFNVPFRKSQLGKQVTGVELKPGKPILPDDVGEYTVEEMRAAFAALTSLTAGFYRSQLQSMSLVFNMQPEWDHYNGAIRTLLPDKTVQILAAPPDAPFGSMGRFMRADGVLQVGLPNDPNIYEWVPDTPQEGLWWANIAHGVEGFNDAAIKRGLEKFFANDPDAVARIWHEFRGE